MRVEKPIAVSESGMTMYIDRTTIQPRDIL